MPARSHLRYHQASFDLLNIVPLESAPAVAAIDACERRIGRPLPRALREWYSLQGVAKPVSRQNRSVPINQIEIETPDADQTSSTDEKSVPLLIIMHENQGVCRWGVRLNGSEDPATMVQLVTTPSSRWQSYADHYSTLIFTEIWDWHTDELSGMAAIDEPPSEATLAFLNTNYVEGPRTYNWPARTTYRWHAPDVRILIWAGEQQADWFVHAKTVGRLEQVCRSLWNLGTLSQTLYGFTDKEHVLLKGLRRE